MCPPLTRGTAGILAPSHLTYPSGLKDLLTVDLFSVYLLSRVDIVIYYIEADFAFGLPNYVRYMEEFVMSRFYSIHFTVFLTGT